MKANKTPSQLTKLQIAERYAELMQELLLACDEPVLAMRAKGFAQTVGLVLGDAKQQAAVSA